MTPVELERRRDRARRAATRRPAVTVEVLRVPRPGIRELLVELLLELLDERRHSGGSSHT